MKNNIFCCPDVVSGQQEDSLKYEAVTILEKVPFRKTNQGIVCVEIGMEWLKIAAAAVGLARKKLTKLNIKKESFAGSLLGTLAESGIKTNAIRTYLPRHLATIRILELPSLDKNEIANMVELQVAKQTPYSNEEVISSFKILGHADKGGYTKVMLAIVRKSIIEERLKLFQEAGMDVKFIGLSSEMISNLCQYSLKFKQAFSKEAVIGLVDMDSNFTDFVFISKYGLVFTRSIFIGLENVYAEPSTWKDKFIVQLKNSIDIYRQQGLSMDVGKIVISKSLEENTGLSAVLKIVFPLPVEVFDFMNVISVSKGISELSRVHSRNISLLACLGTLLLRKEPELNFLPREMQIKRKLETRTKKLTLAGVLLLSFLMLLSAVVAERIYNKTRFLNVLKQEVSRTDKEAAEIEKTKLRMEIIRKYSDKRYSLLNGLRELYEVIPDKIYLSSLSYNNGKGVILAGISETMSDVFQFASTIENLKYFEKVKTNYVAKKGKEDREVVYFELVCAIAR